MQRPVVMVANSDFETQFSNGDDQKRSQLEKLLYNTTKPLLITSQIFICAPTGVHRPQAAVGPRHKLWYHLHLMWSLGLYMTLAVCSYMEYTSSNIELPTVQKPLYFSEYLVYLAHLLEIILAIHWDHQKFWIFQDFFVDFDRKLLDLKLSLNYQNLRRFVRNHAALILLHLVSTLIVTYFYCNGKWQNVIRTGTVYVLPNIIIQISLVQYYALLYMTAKRSDSLYYLLERLLLNAHSLDAWPLRQQLHVLRSLYAKLEQLTRDVNDAFSYSIVLVYVGSYINICINIFLLYKNFNAWSRSELAWSAYSIVWVCMHIGKMTLILYYNQVIQNKKTKASILLSTFRHENQTVGPTIRHFILQLISDTRSNVICGLAALNMNFITSLLVAMSTLFIFLVQYDITFEALTRTHNSGKPIMNMK